MPLSPYKSPYHLIACPLNITYLLYEVRTDMQANTLNPRFEEARKPLAYLGTRSELENELLRIRVHDDP